MSAIVEEEFEAAGPVQKRKVEALQSLGLLVLPSLTTTVASRATEARGALRRRGVAAQRRGPSVASARGRRASVETTGHAAGAK